MDAIKITYIAFYELKLWVLFGDINQSVLISCDCAENSAGNNDWGEERILRID